MQRKERSSNHSLVDAHAHAMQVEALDAEAAALALAAEAKAAERALAAEVAAVAEAAERALTMKALRISRATGPNAHMVSGLFELRDEKVNGRPAWRKSSGMQRMHRLLVGLGADGWCLLQEPIGICTTTTTASGASATKRINGRAKKFGKLPALRTLRSPGRGCCRPRPAGGKFLGQLFGRCSRCRHAHRPMDARVRAHWLAGLQARPPVDLFLHAYCVVDS